jgi:hypothetical protein
MAALVAARMTALRPGASPPPVAIPIQRMSDIKFVGGRSSLVCGDRSTADFTIILGSRRMATYEWAWKK